MTDAVVDDTDDDDDASCTTLCSVLVTLTSSTAKI